MFGVAKNHQYSFLHLWCARVEVVSPDGEEQIDKVLDSMTESIALILVQGKQKLMDSLSSRYQIFRVQ